LAIQLKKTRIFAFIGVAIVLVTTAFVAGTGALSATLARIPSGPLFAAATTSGIPDGGHVTDGSSSAMPSISGNATTTGTNTTTATIAMASSTNKTFYISDDEVDDDLDNADDINIFSLQTMVVNRGDSVTVHFFNLGEEDIDDAQEQRHSFTIGAPYNIDAELAGGENQVITFTADNEGIFQYYSKYDLPQMTGQLVVLPEQQNTAGAATNSTNQ
jgi:plastocyanin